MGTILLAFLFVAGLGLGGNLIYSSGNPHYPGGWAFGEVLSHPVDWALVGIFDGVLLFSVPIAILLLVVGAALRHNPIPDAVFKSTGRFAGVATSTFLTGIALALVAAKAFHMEVPPL